MTTTDGSTLAERRAREIIRRALHDGEMSSSLERLDGRLDTIAARAAKELAGPAQLPAVADIHAIVGAATMESLPDLTNEACMRVADRAAAKLAGAMAGAGAVDFNATERMAVVLASSDKQLRFDRPVLCALLDRLLVGSMAVAESTAEPALHSDRPSIAELQRITRTTCPRCGGPAGACAGAPRTIDELAEDAAMLRNAAPVLVEIVAAALASRRPIETEQDARDSFAACRALDAALAKVRS